MNRRWGVAKFIDLKTFKNPLNGYVVDDSCVFGAEVYIVKNTFKGERLSMMTDPPIYKYTWKVKNFSALASKTYESASFGCYNWCVYLLFDNNYIFLLIIKYLLYKLINLLKSVEFHAIAGKFRSILMEMQKGRATVFQHI